MAPTRVTTYALGFSVAFVLLIYVTAVRRGDREDETCDSNELPVLDLYPFVSTDSTQDEAKRILNEQQGSNQQRPFAVTATEQSNGRGTSGRVWMGARGNTFVTIGFPQTWWPRHVPLTLLPLKVGSIVAQQIVQVLETYCCNEPDQLPFVHVKWPNDVLVENEKIAGVLIESQDGWFLIGIGVNVAYAPQVPTSGPNHGRKSTCIQFFCSCQDDEKNSVRLDPVPVAEKLGLDMAYQLVDWLQASSPQQQQESSSANAYAAQALSAQVLEEWKLWVDWDMELVLRDLNDKTPVVPVEVLSDGRLKVRDRNGRERLVVSDYFL